MLSPLALAVMSLTTPDSVGVPSRAQPSALEFPRRFHASVQSERKRGRQRTEDAEVHDLDPSRGEGRERSRRYLTAGCGRALCAGMTIDTGETLAAVRTFPPACGGKVR